MPPKRFSGSNGSQRTACCARTSRNRRRRHPVRGRAARRRTPGRRTPGLWRGRRNAPALNRARRRESADNAPANGTSRREAPYRFERHGWWQAEARQRRGFCHPARRGACQTREDLTGKPFPGGGEERPATRRNRKSAAEKTTEARRTYPCAVGNPGRRREPFRLGASVFGSCCRMLFRADERCSNGARMPVEPLYPANRA